MRAPAIVVLMTSLISGAAFGQITKPLTLGVGAGFSAPTGDAFDNAYDIGYNILGTVAFQQRPSPLGFRVDGMLNEFNLSGTSGKTRVWSITGNVVLSAANFMGPYLIGGAGFYGTSTPLVVGTNQSDSHLGLNVGAGFRFPLSGFDAFLEARWNRVGDTSIRFIPVTFGVLF
jgi:hypothetical protein